MYSYSHWNTMNNVSSGCCHNTARRLSLRIVITVEARRIHVTPPVLTTRKMCIHCGTRAATIFGSLYNSCDRVYGNKDCVRSLQAQTTAVQIEGKERKKRQIHTSVSARLLLLLLLFSLFSLRFVVCITCTRMALLRSYLFFRLLFWSYQSIGKERF